MIKQKVKCPTCGSKFDSLDHSIRMETSEGPHEISVCQKCSDLFNIICEKINENYANTIRLHKQHQSD